MMHNVLKDWLLSLSNKWTVEDRNRYGLIPRDTARKLLEQHTEQQYGYNLWLYTLWYLINHRNPVGLTVIVGYILRQNRKDLELNAQRLEDGDI